MSAEPDGTPFAKAPQRAPNLLPDSVGDARPARATVHAGGHVTEYQRAGSGPTIILLAACDATPLLAILAARFRVIAPQVPQVPPLPRVVSREREFGAGRAADESWLADFLDGLGVSGARLVVEELLAESALRFCLAHPTRVDRLAIVTRDAVDGIAPPSRAVMRAPAAPVLLVRGFEDDESVANGGDALLHFLSTEPSALVVGPPPARERA